MDNLEAEFKHFMVNNHLIEHYRSEDDLTESIEKVLSSSTSQNTISLRLANSTTSLLFLKSLFKLKAIGRKRRFLAFASCSFDHRFFEFLADQFPSANREIPTGIIILQFFGDCRLKLNGNADRQVITECFNQMGRLQVYMWRSIPLQRPTKPHSDDFLLQVQLNVSSSTETRDMENYFTIRASQNTSETVVSEGGNSQQNQQEMFISLRVDGYKIEVSDIPLVLMTMSCPNLILIECLRAPMTRSLSHRLATEFRKRSSTTAYILPCRVIFDRIFEPPFGVYMLDWFHQTKLTNLFLAVSHATESSDWWERILNVLSHSIYLEEFELDIRQSFEAQNYLTFLTGLRKIASRMRPFKMSIFMYENNREDARAIKKLEEQIHMILQRNSNFECQAVMFLVWANEINLKRAGQACLVRMLPLDLFRELHQFLVI